MAHCKEKNTVMSSVPLRFVHDINVEQRNNVVHVHGTTYLWNGDRPVEAARVGFDIRSSNGNDTYPWLPKCKVHMGGFYNFFTGTARQSRALQQLFQSFSDEQKAQTKGLTCALMKATLQTIVNSKLATVQDCVWIEASGSQSPTSSAI